MEQGEVSGCRVGSCEYIIHFDVLLIVLQQCCEVLFKRIVSQFVGTQRIQLLVHILLKIDLFQRQFLYLTAVFRSFYRVGGREINVWRVDL
mgnify:CR=1 FL=1